MKAPSNRRMSPKQFFFYFYNGVFNSFILTKCCILVTATTNLEGILDVGQEGTMHSYFHILKQYSPVLFVGSRRKPKTPVKNPHRRGEIV